MQVRDVFTIDRMMEAVEMLHSILVDNRDHKV